MFEEGVPSPSNPMRRVWIPAVVLVLVIMAAFGYSVRQKNAASRLAAENDQMKSALQQTQNQMDALNARLNEMSAAQAAAAQQAAERNSVAHNSGTRSGAHRRHREDPRWKQVKEELAKHQQEIESTQQDLASARTELSGSIAKTHGELVALQRKGERNYYEFDLDKSKQFHSEGPVGLRLSKANTKHQYADLEMLVDDVRLSKKHVNLYEPVMFYPADSKQPVELVINKIQKNHIHGYVSTPKYKPSELQAMAQGDAAASAPAAATDSNSAPASSDPTLKRRSDR